MIQAITKFFVRINERYLPESYLFAGILTIVTFVMCLIFTPSNAYQTMMAWGNGIWNLLAFTCQMVSIMVFGYAFAKTAFVERILSAICSKIHTPKQAYFWTSFVSAVVSLLCWAAGLICGAFIAVELGKKIKGIHYPLLVASAYSGFLVFQLGLTGSVSLLVATPGHFLEKMIGIIPVSQTMLAPWNIFLAVVIGLLVVPSLMTIMSPPKDEILEIDPTLFETPPSPPKAEKKDMLPNEKLENSYILNLLVGGGLAIYLVVYFLKDGALTINSTNLLFMVLGIILTPTPIEYVRRCTEGAGTVGGVVMQFPLYAGIQGMMLSTGLAKVIAGWFVAISTPQSFPVWSFISAGVINMFIPSGGSQWAVQGPIMLDAAKQLGVDAARVSMAVSYGDNWTNMIQPFWALPLLAIAKMRARDVMGFLTLVLIVSGIIFMSVLYFWP